MEGDILEYLGSNGTGFIHAGGRLATFKMMSLVRPQEGEKIMEIGFGTGATLVEMAASSKADFFGFEYSETMFVSAKRRIRFCIMEGRIQISLLKSKNQIPIADNTFDKIYAESIIAIQEGQDIRDLLIELKRVLKPNGMLIFNETIWLDSTDFDTAKSINEHCKQSFGIIQSNQEYLHLKDWKKLLKHIGFSDVQAFRMSEVPPLKQKINGQNMRSLLFSLYGRIKSMTSFDNRRIRKGFKKKMDRIVDKDIKLMEGIFLKVCKG